MPARTHAASRPSRMAWWAGAASSLLALLAAACERHPAGAATPAGPAKTAAPSPATPAPSPTTAAPAAPAAPAASAAAAPATPSAPATIAAPWSRIGVIGASATAGFGVLVLAPGKAHETSAGADLADVVRAAANASPVVSLFGTMFFFSTPIQTGDDEVTRVLASHPTLVLGLDFLFWYGYGNDDLHGRPITREAQRLELLEEGLRQLDRITAAGIPLVVSDLPDMRAAAGGILSESQVPEPETLRAINSRIRAWAAERRNVRVVSLSTLVPAFQTEDTIEIGGRRWSRKDDGALVQRDHLHPTFAGLVAMFAEAVNQVESMFPGSTNGLFTLDPAVVRTRVLEAVNSPRPRGAAPAGPRDPSRPRRP